MTSLNGPSNDADQDDDTAEYGFIYGYVCVIEKFPGIIATLICLATLGCGAIALLIYGFPLLDDPSLGLENRGTELSARDLSFVKFLNADSDILSPIPGGYIDALRGDAMNSLKNGTRMRRPESSPCPPPNIFQPQIVFEPSKTGASLLEAEHLKSICQQEERLVRSHPSFIEECHRMTEENSGESACCPSWSLGYAVALLNNKTSCSEIVETDVSIARDILKECSQFYTPKRLAGDRRLLPSHCRRGDAVFNIFHYLTLNTFSGDIRNGKDDIPSSLSFSPMNCSDESCLSLYDDNFQEAGALSDGITKIVALEMQLKIPLFDRILIADFVYIALGLTIVAGIIWLYTGSFLITIGSILNMFFSAVLATFFYHVVFQVPVFLFPNFSAFVLVIGIGADDAFVYVDLYKAAKVKFDGRERRRQLALQEATHHAMLTLFVTSLTTSAALYTNVISGIIAARLFALYAGTALACNFFYTITWLPAIIVLHDKYFELRNSATDDHHSHPKACLRFLGKMLNKIRQASFLTDTFQIFLPTVVYRLKYVWVVTFLLIGAAGCVFTFVYPRLEITENPVHQLFKDTHPFERYDQFYRQKLDFIRSSGYKFPIFFIWGILPTHESNGWNPFDVGSLEFDSDFQFGDEESQEWLVDFCVDLKQQWFYGNKTDFCFIESFREWMSRPCFTIGESPCCDQLMFPFPREIFGHCSKQYSAVLCQRESCSSSTPGLRFDVNGSINALFLYSDSSVPFTTQFAQADEFWKALSSWADEKFLAAPPGLARGWSFCAFDTQLRLYDVQTGLQNDTLLTIGLSLMTAAVVLLLSTRNFFITLFAVLTISFTAISTFGSLVWLGWELNVFESLNFTVAVGLAVDFSIHFGVAYGLAPYEDRKGRTTFVITTLGSAITVAAISTFCGGAAMWFSVVITYFYTGTFLMVLMGTTWLFSMFFFLPLCIAFGPEGDAGKLPNLFSRVRRLNQLQQAGSPVEGEDPL